MDESTLPEPVSGNAAAAVEASVPALAILWCGDEPWRAGEVILLPDSTPVSLGRGPARPGEHDKRVFGRQRPGGWTPSPPLKAPSISRRQLLVAAAEEGGVHVTNEGRCALFADGAEVRDAECRDGELLQLGQQLLLLCCRRPRQLPGDAAFAARFAFGAPDPHGIVGESPAAWSLRAALAHVAARPGHVLVTGPSGSGKELAAAAIHALGGGGAFVARSAATLPDSLVDAELFGNARNYPNPGMPERPGLIGEADGGTLFLDEIGELPAALQAHLLRVLDRGEYQRLGESRARTSRFRLLAATNRRAEDLKTDFAARFAFHVEIPGLDVRPEDLPLLARAIVRRSASLGDELARRLFPGGDVAGEPRLALGLVAELVRRPFSTHMRELERVLSRALAGLPAPPVERPRSSAEAGAVTAGRDEGGSGPTAAAGAAQLSAEDVQRRLDDNNGSIERTWRALGFASRFALNRYIRKHGLVVRRRPGAGGVA